MDPIFNTKCYTQAIGTRLECFRWSGDGVEAPNMMQLPRQREVKEVRRNIFYQKLKKPKKGREMWILVRVNTKS